MSRDVDNRDLGEMVQYYESRIKALEKRIRELEAGACCACAEEDYAVPC